MAGKTVLFAVVVGVFAGSYLFFSRPLVHSLSSSMPSGSTPSLVITAVDTTNRAETPVPGADRRTAEPEVTEKPENKTVVVRQHTRGIDVSHDQGSVVWRDVIQSGIGFVYLKASDGMTFHDPMFAVNVQAIAPHQIPVGAYHFFEAGDDPHQQLANFLSATKGHELTLAPMVDVEVSRGVKPLVLQSRLRQFLKGIQQATGCTPVIYSYGDFWQTYIGRSFNRYPFWLADYSPEMARPAGLEHIQLWQHSEQGRLPGIRGAVDLDKAIENTALETIRCRVRQEAV
ncbi:glycoside hydrolase family 25 protein [Vibrio mangrovi]|uniref:Autolytic lysozyme n=1 Tax=Vibrio mangrovi TaxID=474394 RepID=A0A1Y6J024_9VIBR|nr:GH25 family lysozyme [Vibrio mangrovi]MDW6005466.1 GH25 family lysozyme [Vibrio mangrovi]SMS02092.1 Autolytic lysozyme [Vibrio mangrovi]